MKKNLSLRLKAFFLVSLLLLLSGCYIQSAEELYRLPQFPDEYLHLQNEIDKILDAGAEYSAPTSGTFRQAVQLEDLNGDGINEAIAFFSLTGDGKPLKIYIFQSIDKAYECVLTIEGEGTNIESIYYSDLNKDGILEIIVGWQISAGVNMLSVYSFRDYQLTEIISTDYTKYTVYDMNRDGTDDLIVTRLGSSDTDGEVEMFSIASDGEVLRSAARLSTGVNALSRIRTTPLSNGFPAILIEGSIDNSSITTDVFVYKEGVLTNITANASSGISEETMRTYSTYPYSQDINGDGIIEIPVQIPLYSSVEAANYWLTDWLAYASNGSCFIAETTYHNYSEGWFLTIPSEWKNNITVRRVDNVSGERTIIFAYYESDPNKTTDFLAIYTLTGDNRDERSAIPGRITLLKENDVIYSAEILDNSGQLPFALSYDLIKSNFEIIHSEWITGET